MKVGACERVGIVGASTATATITGGGAITAGGAIAAGGATEERETSMSCPDSSGSSASSNASISSMDSDAFSTTSSAAGATFICGADVQSRSSHVARIEAPAASTFTPFASAHFASATPSSCIDGQRSSADFAMPRRTMETSARSIASVMGSGAFSASAFCSSYCDVTANGMRPVSSSYMTTDSDQMSVRASTASPRACSGDIYAGLPVNALS